MNQQQGLGTCVPRCKSSMITYWVNDEDYNNVNSTQENALRNFQWDDNHSHTYQNNHKLKKGKAKIQIIKLGRTCNPHLSPGQDHLNSCILLAVLLNEGMN